MNWRVTYRANDGKQVVEIVEAGSRTEAFKVIAAKGISAIRVEETKGKIKDNKNPSGLLTKSAIAIVAAILASVGAICFIALFSQTHKGGLNFHKPKQAPKTAIREVVSQTNVTTKATSTANHVIAAKEDSIPPRQKIVEMISVITNADGSVLERFRTADGKTRSRQYAPKPIFDNASDQLLAAAISGASSGLVMPPMPMMSNAEEEFRKSLAKEIKINEDDRESVKALKQDVIALREEMRQLLDEGNKFADILNDHRDIVNHGVEMRNEAIRLIAEFVDEGDEESARECLEKMNATLLQMGINAVEMPLSREERREIIREQHKLK